MTELSGGPNLAGSSSDPDEHRERRRLASVFNLLAKRGRFWIGLAALAASIPFLVGAADASALGATWREFVADPAPLVAVLASFAAAFALRAWIWSWVLPALPFRQALAAIHVSLLGNHVLPFRLGEVLRVTSVVRRTDIGVPPATASTLLLRGADVLAVLAIAALFGRHTVDELVGAWTWGVVGFAFLVTAGGLWWLRRLSTRHDVRVRVSFPLIGAGAVAAWLLESAVIWQAARWSGLDVSLGEAVLVTAITIAAQIVAVTPGGLGTYEAAATAGLVAVGEPVALALAAAIAAHALKTAYALVAGGVALFVPAPGFFGRLRLPSRVAAARTGGVEAAAASAPGVILFLPARDEETTVGGVVRRAPARVFGRPVSCLVVDDGSSDSTAEAAAAAGAVVVPVEGAHGLGAAVRRGLAEAVARGAAAVAFCDADGEYAPEELERLVAPILDGKADYVVGSRFAGDARRMRPHRWLGNLAITRVLRFVAREPITDGQSGYRALSAAAAADAEIIHDFNYAQVLTLDLLAKGYRYAEVPISYRFREEGRSFVKLVPYLRNVVPAVHRELNAP